MSITGLYVLVLVFACVYAQDQNTANVDDPSLPSVQGSVYYANLFDQWRFAYFMVSNIDVPYKLSNATNFTDEIYDDISILHNIDVQWENITQSVYAIPLFRFPIAIVYNIPLLNDTFKITPNKLRDMLVSSTMTWNNDPELVQMNPGLANIFSPVRFILNNMPNNINRMLIDYLFPDNNTTTRNSWSGITANRYILSKDYVEVLSALSVSTNSIAFVPLPIVQKAKNPKAKIGKLILNDLEVGLEDIPPLTTSTDGTIARIETTLDTTNTTWPWNIIGYLFYNSESVDCKSLRATNRFIYWSCNNTNLIDTTKASGFDMINVNDVEQIGQTMCRGDPVLFLTNLSKDERSLFMISFSVILCTLFLAMIICRYILIRMRYPNVGLKGAIHTGLIVVGLVLCLAGFVLWWLPPDSDQLCVSRFIVMSFGITLVLSSTFMYAFIINELHHSKAIHHLMSSKRVFMACFGVLIGQGVISLIWVFVENPHSVETIIDPIEWKSRYMCVQNGVAMELIQYIYFCCITLYGAFVVNLLWKEKTSSEDPRLMIGLLYSEIFIFVLLMVVVTLTDLNDENLYVVIAPLFLTSIGNVCGAWFVPRFVQFCRHGVRPRSASMSTVNMTTRDSYTTTSQQ